jgi:signal transduction histidine kinase
MEADKVVQADVEGAISISKSIIEAHGGQFWAQNNPDEGTTFYFTLPIHEEA